MGTSRTAGELAFKIGRAADQLERAQRTMTERAALVMTTAIRSELTADTGDGRMSGVGRRGARVSAGFDVFGSRNPVAMIRPRGPAHLISNATSSRYVTSRHGRGSRAGRARALGGTASRGARRNRAGELVAAGVASSLGVGPAAPGRVRGGRRANLNVPGIGWRRYTRHPGTRGKGSWQRGRQNGTAASAAELTSTAGHLLRETFR